MKIESDAIYQKLGTFSSFEKERLTSLSKVFRHILAKRIKEHCNEELRKKKKELENAVKTFESNLEI